MMLAEVAGRMVAPEVSIWVEGTQEGSLHADVHQRAAAGLLEIADAGRPITLAISCGSQIAVVMPRGVTQRSNSKGVTRELSMWTCVSMKPGTSDQAGDVDDSSPRCSSPVPTMVSSQIAMSPSIIALVRRRGPDRRAGGDRRAHLPGLVRCVVPDLLPC